VIEDVLRLASGAALAVAIHYAVAIRSNHGVWLPQSQTVRENKWRKFDRIFSHGRQQVRYIKEIIFGKKRVVQYWLIIASPKIYYNKTQARKDDCMKVNYPERIEDTMTELKIILSQQGTVTR
jgi:SRSO17 transposase